MFMKKLKCAVLALIKELRTVLIYDSTKEDNIYE